MYCKLLKIFGNSFHVVLGSMYNFNEEKISMIILSTKLKNYEIRI